MSTYRIKISYIGSRYLGWQIQPETLKTVQGQLNRALSKLSKSKDVSTLGSGRTDAGVHALAQIVKATIPIEIASENLMKGLNSQLPEDIRVLDVLDESEDFNPVRDALWKRYCYFLWVGESLPPSAYQRVTHERGIFDLERFRSALDEFVGTHDFENFSTKGTPVKSTVRTLHKAEIKEVNGFFPFQESFDGKLYCVTFEGDGFLKQMVRLLIGTALMVSRGKVSREEVKSFFQQDRSDKLGPVASADGLYLEHVEYQDSWTARD